MCNKEKIYEYISEDNYLSAIKAIDEAIDEAIDVEANNSYYLYLKGYCFSKLGNYLKTITLCKEALKAGLKAEECYLLIGQSYISMGWLLEAKESFLIGLEINENNTEIKAAYAYILLRAETIDKAYNFMLQAIKENVNNFIVIHYAIYFYLNRKDIKNEKHWILKTYMESGSSEITKNIKLGLEAFENQKFKLAKEYFEKAYLLDSENDAIIEMLEQLKFKSKMLYRPLVIIDMIGGWNKWGQISGLLGVGILFMILIQQSGLAYAVVGSAFILWVFMGVYKFALDLLYLGG